MCLWGFCFVVWLDSWWIDPDRRRQFGRSRNPIYKAFRSELPSLLESSRSCGDDFGGLAVVQRTCREQPDATVIMLVVVPIEESTTEPQCILVAAKAFREVGTVLHGLELAFGKWIVIGNMRSAV